MLGFTAPWRSGEPRRVDEELEDVRWFDRDALVRGRSRAASDSPLGVPPPFAIARRLMEQWVASASLPCEVTLEGWIFMVGLRVFDIGALVVWLVWFFRLRDDDDDADGGHGGGGNAPEPDKPERAVRRAAAAAGRLQAMAHAPARPPRRPPPLPGVRSPRHPPPGARPRTDQTTLIAIGRARSCGPEC